MNRTIQIRCTVTVDVPVEDDFPVPSAEITRIADWLGNDWRDGRYPFSVEMVHDGVMRLVGHVVERSIEEHYDRRIEKHFGRERMCAMPYDRRERLYKSARTKVGHYRVSEDKLDVSAHEGEGVIGEPHVVLCREGAFDPECRGEYRLATRTVFESRVAADTYAKSISESREAIVVALPLGELRVGEERGTNAYWKRLAGE